MFAFRGWDSDCGEVSEHGMAMEACGGTMTVEEIVTRARSDIILKFFLKFDQTSRVIHGHLCEERRRKKKGEVVQRCSSCDMLI